jgi:hypothetical protein
LNIQCPCPLAAAPQKRDLRNYAALAVELGAKLMLTGVFKHHIDNKRLVRLR